MQGKFVYKIEQAIARGAKYGLVLRPQVIEMPLPIQRFDDPFLPFGKAIINATRDLVSLYVFDFASYLAIGAAGVVALERTIALVMAGGDCATLLHMPAATADYLRAVSDNALNVDAVTVTDETIGAQYAAAGIEPIVFGRASSTSAACDQSLTRLTLSNGTTILLFAEEVTLASRGDDFAEAARAALISRAGE